MKIEIDTKETKFPLWVDVNKENRAIRIQEVDIPYISSGSDYNIDEIMFLVSKFVVDDIIKQCIPEEDIDTPRQKEDMLNLLRKHLKEKLELVETATA